MPIVEGVEQGTPEWLAMRIGCVTGSRVADVMATLARGNGESKERARYKAQLAIETLSGRAADHYVTPAMQWGIDNEPLARAAYELARGVDVLTVGFALHDRIERFGASPDGLVGADGLVEIKCPTTETHIGYILGGVAPAQYHWQMLAQIACTGRKWCDFVSFDPRLPKRLQMFVRRFERDDARIAELEDGVVKFLAEVHDLIAKIESVSNE